MATLVINEETELGKSILEILKTLAKVDNSKSIKFLDETEYLLSSEPNRNALMNGVSQINKGTTGKLINPSELWE